MVKVASSFNVGDRENITVEKLLEIVERMYTDLAEAVNSKPSFHKRITDGQTDDTFLPDGDINLNTTTDKVEMLTEHIDPTTVQWTQLS
ncbi:unnamed protein product [marine sediment metagenome]|uniref:Uncharacterized protein n=1 Tax=marine sediment metagenome TaxID=412755 RepID=X0SKB3_9ZZZZ